MTDHTTDRALAPCRPNAVTLGLRVDEEGPGHVRLSVFVGRQRGARGLAGTLVVRTDEWTELADQLPADLEVLTPYDEVRAGDLRVGDVLADGGTVTYEAVIRDGFAVVEVDHTVQLSWPAEVLLRACRPEEVTADA